MISRLAKGLAVAVAAFAFADIARAADGPYIRGDLGWAFEGSFDVEDNGPVAAPPIPGVMTSGDLSFDGGWVGSVGGGYAFPYGLRLEGELAYRFDDIESNDLADQGGDASSWALMFNGYYDFNKGGRWEPYVGLGIGYANVEVSASDANPLLVSLDDSADAWAWQAMAGVAWWVNDRIAVDMSYRYFEAPEVELDSSRGVEREGDYVQQAAMIGVRYSLSPPPEPAPPPPPPPAPRPVAAPPSAAACPTSEFVVYFAWDRADLDQAGQDTIRSAISRARQCNLTQVEVVGHTDTSGATDYNLDLSGRRATAVRDALVAGGISGEIIRSESRGETEQARQTADGVREPLNRRAAVTIRFR